MAARNSSINQAARWFSAVLLSALVSCRQFRGDLIAPLAVTHSNSGRENSKPAGQPADHQSFALVIGARARAPLAQLLILSHKTSEPS